MRKLVWLAAAAAAMLAAVVWLRAQVTASQSPGSESTAAVSGDPSQRNGALVDEVVFTEESDPGKVVGEIETGARQLLAQGITSPIIYRQIRNASGVDFELSYGSSAELTFNPAGPVLDNGDLNPFAVPTIREAMNWLVDRRYIASELYGGLAEPRYLPLSTAFPDYARLAATARELELHYRYRPEHARQLISERMRKLGATLEDGRWQYHGRPVRLRILIRTEDTRRQVGDYVANRLQDIGFTIDRLYRTADQAGPIWLASNPAAGRWNIYTGGWVATVINRDQAQNFSDFYTPRGRPSPLWQAYRPSPHFDQVARRLERRDYDSWDQRQQLMREALKLAMKDSVRIWLVDQLNVWPHAADVELAADLAGGVAGSALWPYTLRYKGRIGGQVIVSTPSLLTDPWNPIAGTNWLYDQMISRALLDPAVLPDPYTGLYRPQRIAEAQVTVTEGTPVHRTLDWVTLDTAKKIIVPTDAWIGWDGEAGRFVTVGERHPGGLAARTRTRLRFEAGYLQRRWQDGAQKSLADIVLPMILEFARADENSPLFDRSHVPEHKTFVRHFRGWRIVSTEPLVIDIYSDQIYPDGETIAAARTPTMLPWHVLALGIRAERSGELAFSSDKADRNKVPWLSLVSGPSLAILDRYLKRARAEGYLPFKKTLGRMVRDGGVAARYRALADWRRQHEHYWVGDGPFYLDAVYPVAGTLILKRDGEFPDSGAKWLRFTSPPIPEPSLDGPLVVPLDRGADFRLDITSGGSPYPSDAVEAVSYLLFNGAGDLTDRGQVERVDGRWRVSLPARTVTDLGAGANRLEVIVRSSRVALPRFASHVFATVPPRAGGSP